jgi:hypothetical protein
MKQGDEITSANQLSQPRSDDEAIRLIPCFVPESVYSPVSGSHIVEQIVCRASQPSFSAASTIRDTVKYIPPNLDLAAFKKREV